MVILAYALAARAADVTVVVGRVEGHGPEDLTREVALAAATLNATLRELHPGASATVTVWRCDVLAARVDPARRRVEVCLGAGDPEGSSTMEGLIVAAATRLARDPRAPADPPMRAGRDGGYAARVSVDDDPHSGAGRVDELFTADEVRALRWDGEQLVARVVDRGVVADVTWPGGAPIWSLEPDPPVAARPYAAPLGWAAAPSMRLGDVARSFVAVVAEATDPLGHRGLVADVGLGARSWAWLEAERRAGASVVLQAGHRVTDAASADTDLVVTAGSTGRIWARGGLGATVPWRFDTTSHTGPAVGSTWAAAGWTTSMVRLSALAGASLASSELAPWTRGAAEVDAALGPLGAEILIDGWWAAPNAPEAILPLVGPAPKAEVHAATMRTIARSSVLPDLVAQEGLGGAGVARVGWPPAVGSVTPRAALGVEALVGADPVVAPSTTIGVAGRFGEVSLEAAIAAPVGDQTSWGAPVLWLGWSTGDGWGTVQP